MKKQLLKTIAALAISAASFTAAHAQSLFTTITDASAGLTTKETEKLASLRLNPHYASITMIRLADVPTIAANGKITVDIPGHGTQTAIAYAIDHNSHTATSDFNWEGTLYKDTAVNGDTTHEGGGTLTLYRRNGEVFGHIRDLFSGNVFEIASFAQGKNALIQYSRDVFTEATEDEEYTGAVTPAEKVTGSPCNTHVKVFVFYTSAAKNAVVNINNTIQTAIGDLYGTVNNSLGNQDEVSFELVGQQELQNFYETTTGLNPILSTLDGFQNDITVNDNRDGSGADVCVLLTDGNFMNGTKPVWGLSVPGPSLAAFSVIEADLCNPQYTFSHEVGHLLGAQHTYCADWNTSGCDGSGTLAHPKSFSRFNLGGSIKYETVMYIIDGPDRSHLWSTPQKKIWKTEMGDLEHRYNTKVITDNACTVAAFRPDESAYFNLAVSGTNAAHTGDAVTLYATPHNGTLPYTSYTWEMEIGLFNYVTLPSTTSTLTMTMPANERIYISAYLKDAIGRQVSASHKVANLDAKYIDQWDGQDAHNRAAKTNQDAMLIVAPNPAAESINIVALLPETDLSVTHTLTITDIAGKVVYSNTEFSGTQTNFAVSTSNLPSGTYFVKLTGGIANKVLKIIVSH